MTPQRIFNRQVFLFHVERFCLFLPPSERVIYCSLLNIVRLPPGAAAGTACRPVVRA